MTERIFHTEFIEPAEIATKHVIYILPFLMDESAVMSLPFYEFCW